MNALATHVHEGMERSWSSGCSHRGEEEEEEQQSGPTAHLSNQLQLVSWNLWCIDWLIQLWCNSRKTAWPRMMLCATSMYFLKCLQMLATQVRVGITIWEGYRSKVHLIQGSGYEALLRLFSQMRAKAHSICLGVMLINYIQWIGIDHADWILLLKFVNSESWDIWVKQFHSIQA